MVKCPKCGSKNCIGISRIVGYYSIIEDWNKSKTAELKDRQKGHYDIKEKEGKWKWKTTTKTKPKK